MRKKKEVETRHYAIRVFQRSTKDWERQNGFITGYPVVFDKYRHYVSFKITDCIEEAWNTDDYRHACVIAKAIFARRWITKVEIVCVENRVLFRRFIP